MKDQAMTDILKNLNKVEDKDNLSKKLDPSEIKHIEQSANPNKDAMRFILEGLNNVTEGLDAQQKSVNQMPATHKMAKATDTKHPASEYLVGGEEGEAEPGQEVVAEIDDPMADNDEYQALAMRYNMGDKSVLDQMHQMRRGQVDKDYPTPFDEDTVTEGGLRSVKVTFDDGNSLTTNMAANLSDEQIYDYYKVGKRFNLGDGAGGDNVVSVANVEILEGAVEEDTIAQRKPSSDVHKKQSLSDLFRSMEEAENEKKGRLEKEFHSELKNNSPVKNDKGTYNLAENTTGDKLFMVRCVGNFWGGKYYETGIDSIVVAAGDSDEAEQIAQQHTDAVINHFQNKRVGGGARKRPALRPNDNKIKVRGAKPVSQTKFHKVLQRDGTVGPVDLGEVAVTESNETIANLDSMVDDMKRLMSDGSMVTVHAWEAHKDPKYKGQIYGYRMQSGKPEKVDESASDSLDELVAAINNLKFFGESFKSVKEEFRVNDGETFVKLAQKIRKAVQDIRRQGGVS